MDSKYVALISSIFMELKHKLKYSVAFFCHITSQHSNNNLFSHEAPLDKMWRKKARFSKGLLALHYDPFHKLDVYITCYFWSVRSIFHLHHFQQKNWIRTCSCFYVVKRWTRCSIINEIQVYVEKIKSRLHANKSTSTSGGATYT